MVEKARKDGKLIESPYQHFLFEAFFELSTERQLGMSMGPIPVTAMMKHAELYGLDHQETLAFITVMRQTDKVYLELVAEQSEKASKAANKNQRTTR